MYDKSAIEVFTTPLGLQRYRLPAVYTQLSKHRNISSDTPEFAVHKAVFQNLLWKSQHEHFMTVKRKKLGLEMNAKRADVTARQKKKIAEGRNELAQQEIDYAYNVLARALQQNPAFSWDTLKKYPDYPNPIPKEPSLPTPPDKSSLPREPKIRDAIFRPKLDAMDRIMRSKREQKEKEARVHFETAHTQWQQLTQRVQRLRQEQALQYKKNFHSVKEKYQQKIEHWNQEKESYYREREKCTQIIESKKLAFAEGDPHAIIDYFDMVLAFSNYPPLFPQSYDVDFDVENKVLVVDYLLPPLKALPRLKAVDYDKNSDSFHESVLSEDERNHRYAQLLHEIPLRTFHEIYEFDTEKTLTAVQFRGFLYLQQEAKKGGVPSCILSIRADRSLFSSIKLSEQNPLNAFTELGGIIQATE
ncbi:MAG: hypothetical protein KAH38_00755 [Candidatus Hydrogenedentes bacterium]|nr:hypothetical protein [Candidatus Hydrogenedentota bacterium]